VLNALSLIQSIPFNKNNCSSCFFALPKYRRAGCFQLLGLRVAPILECRAGRTTPQELQSDQTL
jgi:hypothetical protein